MSAITDEQALAGLGAVDVGSVIWCGDGTAAHIDYPTEARPGDHLLLLVRLAYRRVRGELGPVPAGWTLTYRHFYADRTPPWASIHLIRWWRPGEPVPGPVELTFDEARYDIKLIAARSYEAWL